MKTLQRTAYVSLDEHHIHKANLRAQCHFYTENANFCKKRNNWVENVYHQEQKAA